MMQRTVETNPQARALLYFMGIASFATSLTFAEPQPPDAPPAADAAPNNPVEILDDPRAIDPATLIDARLAAPATVEFDGTSMKELYRWLQDDQKLSVSVDAAAMTEAGILSSELVAEKLNEEPLYLILDRLKSLGIGWHEEAGDFFLTTLEAADQQMTTVSYNLGELLDAKFEGNRIVEAISSATGGKWISNGDEDGAVVMLGDVVFVRQTQQVQREVRGLLAGLKTPARRTLTLDPPQHAQLREKLVQKFSITLEEIPLQEAIAEIAGISGADIRLNAAELKSAGIRDRSPVSIDMTDQKLSIVLQSVLSELKLTPLIQDGVIWIVLRTTAESATRTAIYDVRDLCRDESESEALKHALMEQTGAHWVEHGDNDGTILFARPGIMVVRHTDATLDQILQLLENYRTALRGSKPRAKSGPDPKEVVTHYYRLPSEMAKDLEVQLKALVRPDTWKNEQQPDAPGMILKLVSTTDIRDSLGNTPVRVAAPAQQPKSHVLVVENSVLMIRQSREVHEEIDELIGKITAGSRPSQNLDGSGGGLGGGGFGGGFFQLE